VAGLDKPVGNGLKRDMSGEAMKFEYVADQAMALAYRWAGYALLNWADDAAILALVFC
jgi:hypothetical protein